MITRLSKRYFAVWGILFPLLFFLSLHFARGTANAEGHKAIASVFTTPTITDDAIDSFLFRINDDIKKKVLMLAGEPVEHLPIPILFGVSIGDFKDTWVEARTGGRVHTGTDIIAPLGELLVSPTDAVVTKIGYDNRGGNFVITANPGGEQLYFAHLDRAAENLTIGDILKPGDLIGYVGNTGNARGKLPHLHLGIYYKGIAQNPFPRLVYEFTSAEKLAAVEKILAVNKIALGANNAGVRFLQRFLIRQNTGSHSKILAGSGATGYFGLITKNALSEYQQATKIAPSSGYFGSVTKANILSALNPNSTKSYAKTLASVGATGYFGVITKDALAEYQFAVDIKPASGYFGPITRTSIRILGGN